MKRALILMSVLIAACGRETATETAATPPPATTVAKERNVCEMMTIDEIKTAAGIEEAVGQSSKSGGADVCTWSGSGGKMLVVQVFPYASSYDDSRKAFEGLYGGTAADVTGVGEKAFFLPGKTGPIATGTLVAQKGSTPISVQVMGGSGDDKTRQGEATAIAHVILGKL